MFYINAFCKLPEFNPCTIIFFYFYYYINRINMIQSTISNNTQMLNMMNDFYSLSKYLLQIFLKIN